MSGVSSFLAFYQGVREPLEEHRLRRSQEPPHFPTSVFILRSVGAPRTSQVGLGLALSHPLSASCGRRKPSQPGGGKGCVPRASG